MYMITCECLQTIRNNVVFIFLGALICLGLFFQAKYPIFFSIYFSLFFIIFFINTKYILLPGPIGQTFGGLAVLVGVFMPLLFSPMPMTSIAAGYYLTFAVVLGFLLNKRHAYFVLYTLILYGLVDTLYSTYQYTVITDRRPFGFFSDWNIKAFYLFGAALFLFERMATVQKYKNRIISYMAILILMFGMHMAQSRAATAISGFAFIGLWIFVLSTAYDKNRVFKRHLFIFTGLFIVSFILFIALSVPVGNSEIRVATTTANINGRLPLWISTWELIKVHPLTGHGYGLFLNVYDGVRSEYATSGHVAHNDFLEFWMTSGILGLIMTILPVYYFLSRIIIAFQNADLSRFIFSGIGLSFLACAFFNFFFWRVENLLVLLALWKLAQPSYQFEREVAIPFVVKVFIVASVTILALIPIAHSYQDKVVSRSEGSIKELYNWSDSVLGDESLLVPLRAQYFIDLALFSGAGQLDFNGFDFILGQLDSEISRGTLFPEVYCARGQISFLLDETYVDATDHLTKGVSLSPRNIYCQYASFRNSVLYGRPDEALSGLSRFLDQKIPMDRVDSLRTLVSLGLKLAIEESSDDYAVFFSTVLDGI